MYPLAVSPAVRFRLAVVLLLLGWVASVFADDIPATLRPNWPELEFYETDLPVWVSASQAFDKEGKLISSLFRQEKREKLERLLQLPRDPATGCSKVLWIEQEYVDPPNRSSLAAAAESAELVLLGKVVARDFGFERGQMGQMLMVQPVEVIKPAGRTAARAYFVFVPAGRLKFKEHEVCKEDPRVVIPEIGDEVIVFPRYAPQGEPFLNLEYDGSMLAFEADGSVKWPDVMSPSRAATPLALHSRADVLEQLRAEVEKLERGQ